MKKHTAMFLTFSALLTLNAYAPQVLWEGSKSAARFPASEESKTKLKADEAESSAELQKSEKELKLSKIELEIEEIRTGLRLGKFENNQDEKETKLEKLIDEDTAIRAEIRKDRVVKGLVIPEFKNLPYAIDSKLIEIIDVKPEERAQINLEAKIEKNKLEKEKVVKDPEVTQCAKEEKAESLEEKIIKLVADKEAMIKEIEELKKSKSDSKDSKESKEESRFAKKEKAEKTPKHQYTSDYMSLLSEMTSAMMSQQQQQMMMMQQMFSLFAPAQKSQGIESYYSPYSFTPSRLEMSYEQYPLGYSRHQVGIDFMPHQNESYYRQPSAYNEQMQPQIQQPMQQQQLQVPSLTPVTHDGFNFGSSLTSFNRVQF
jgi:hypothetical protein